MNMKNPLQPLLLALATIILALASGCTEQEMPPSPSPVAQKTPEPPSPPLFESFDSEPRLSLFPRVARFRPESDHPEEFAVWSQLIDHLSRLGGARPGTGTAGSTGFSVRALQELESVGFFSPLEVEPSTKYTLEFDIRGVLPEGGKAGAGILEFEQFRWIPAQYTETEMKEGFLRDLQLAEFAGAETWRHYKLSFETSPLTGMIHIVFYREGTTNRDSLYFDNISITPGSFPDGVNIGQEDRYEN